MHLFFDCVQCNILWLPLIYSLSFGTDMLNWHPATKLHAFMSFYLSMSSCSIFGIPPFNKLLRGCPCCHCPPCHISCQCVVSSGENSRGNWWSKIWIWQRWRNWCGADLHFIACTICKSVLWYELLLQAAFLKCFSDGYESKSYLTVKKWFNWWIMTAPSKIIIVTARLWVVAQGGSQVFNPKSSVTVSDPPLIKFHSDRAYGMILCRCERGKGSLIVEEHGHK